MGSRESCERGSLDNEFVDHGLPSFPLLVAWGIGFDGQDERMGYLRVAETLFQHIGVSYWIEVAAAVLERIAHEAQAYDVLAPSGATAN